VYFSFVIDVYSRMIVGWQLATNMRTDLVLDALRMALCTRQPGAGFTLVAHTDQGSQGVSEDYTQVLDDVKVLASVGSVGDAYDNALAESFVDSFKTELIKDRVWHSNAKLELAIVEYVAWFNTRRLHSSIGNRPPAEHEAEWCARGGSQPNTLSQPEALFSPNAAGEYDPSGGRTPMHGSRQWHTDKNNY
jgi:putative transposase